MKIKNLRRINIVVTAQTLWHLRRLAAMAGWGEKDLGRVIDKLVRNECSSRSCGAERKGFKHGNEL